MLGMFKFGLFTGGIDRLFSLVKTDWYCSYRTSALPLVSVVVSPCLLVYGGTPKLSRFLFFKNL